MGLESLPGQEIRTEQRTVRTNRGNPASHIVAIATPDLRATDTDDLRETQMLPAGPAEAVVLMEMPMHPVKSG
jgi:hypothetical protein